MLRFKARRRQSPALKPQGELTASERRVIRMLDAAMQAVARQAQSQLTRIADAVAHKPEGAVADLVTVDPWYEMQGKLEAELLAEYLDAGSRVQLPAIQKATLNFAFDRTRPESAAWARTESANLVREITEGQRQAIRDVIVFGQEQGLSPVDTARRIQQTVGLTSQQAGWVSNFHTRQVTAGIASGLSLEQAVAAANGATARYQQQIHRYRAMTIARTEIMRANSQGRQAAWGQGLQGGWISPTAQKEWIAEMDACEICAPINGTRVGVNALFPIGEPPAHPNCRCDVLLIPDPVPTDLSGLSGAQLDSMIGDLLSGDLLPTVPTPGAQTLIPMQTSPTRALLPPSGATRVGQTYGRIIGEDEWLDGLTDAQRAALRDYTGKSGDFSADELNYALRRGDLTPDQAQRVDAIDDAVRRAVDAGLIPPDEALLYRGQSLEITGRPTLMMTEDDIRQAVYELAMERYPVGSEVNLGRGSFVSTSTDVTPALDASVTSKSPGIVFEILPTRGAPMQSVTRYDDEYEFLLGRDQRFRVVSVQRDQEFLDSGMASRPRTVVQLEPIY